MFITLCGLFMVHGAGDISTYDSNCTSSLLSIGVSERFPGVVAHAIHSIDVLSLRNFFKSDVGESNGIPTINRDLTTDWPIVPDAPLLAESPFKTTAMKVLDEVLTHMDDSSYDAKQYSALERMEHAFHMQEVWAAASIEYKNILENPPPKGACLCITDVEQNGIMKMLRFIALKVREPELMYGKHTTVNGKFAKWNGNIYTYNFATTAQANSLDSGELFPHLTSAASWKVWKDSMLQGMRKSDDYESALYFYCALNAK